MYHTTEPNKIMLQLPHSFLPTVSMDKYLAKFRSYNYGYNEIRGGIESTLVSASTEAFNIVDIVNDVKSFGTRPSLATTQARIILSFRLDNDKANLLVIQDSIATNMRAANIAKSSASQRLRFNNLRLMVLREDGAEAGLFTIKRFAFIQLVEPTLDSDGIFTMEFAFNLSNLEYKPVLESAEGVSPPTTHNYTRVVQVDGSHLFLPPTAYIHSSVIVAVNGVRQSVSSYVIGPAGINVVDAHLEHGDLLSIDYDVPSVSRTYVRKVIEHEVTETGLTLLHLPNIFDDTSIELFVNGLRQKKNNMVLDKEYVTISSNLDINKGDRVDISYFSL